MEHRAKPDVGGKRSETEDRRTEDTIWLFFVDSLWNPGARIPKETNIREIRVIRAKKTLAQTQTDDRKERQELMAFAVFSIQEILLPGPKIS